MSTTSATLPNRDVPTGAGPGHRPLSAIAAAAGGGVPQARIRRVLADLAAPLAELHRQGGVHGAIAMSTIGLDSSGKAHLLVPPLEPAADAEGGARLEGYAAFEQYTDDPERPCGPWTDIYALSAVAHSLLVGAAPPGALARCVKDTYVPLAGRELGAYDPGFLQAVDRGLSMTPAARPQDIEVFSQLVGLGLSLQPVAEPQPVQAASEPELPPVAAPPKPGPGPRVPLLVMLSVLAAVAFAVYLWLRPGAPSSQLASRATPPAPPPAAAPAQPEPPVPTPPALSDLGTPRTADPAAPPAPPAEDTVPAPSDPGPAAVPGGTPPGGAAPPTAQPPVDPAVPPAGSAPPDPAQSPQDAQPPADPAVPSVPGEPAPAGSADPAGTTAPDALAAPGMAPDSTDPAAAAGAPGDESAVPPETAPGQTPPVEPPPAASVAVRVHVQPWGEVLVDGRSRGISPPLTQLTLSPGQHRVTIRNPAAPDYNTTVNISAGGSASISHVFE
ncbi:hypothetical protein [Bordetella sp. BOR01]|uniref:hypothetical protein n=1 Tax=Bordetella sp. BOR01 TaxID=2854779 RepID=UPI001C4794A1|nr:hypothetical protein [Bordetella sp. BOR01]MBV7483541.1 hypothetical protein [Bordetella sp. BOR01]